MESEKEMEMSFAEHLNELFVRILASFIVPVIFLVPAMFFTDKIVASMIWVASILNIQLYAEGSIDITQRFIWGALAGFLIFHYTFFPQLYFFILPGLYNEERKLLRIIFLWVLLVPLITCLLLWAMLLFDKRMSMFEFHQVGEVRAMYIRVYFVTIISTLLLTIPRKRKNLSVFALLIATVLIFIAPNHMFDSLIVTIMEMSLLMSVAIVLVLLVRLLKMRKTETQQ